MAYRADYAAYEARAALPPRPHESYYEPASDYPPVAAAAPIADYRDAYRPAEDPEYYDRGIKRRRSPSYPHDAYAAPAPAYSHSRSPAAAPAPGGPYIDPERTDPEYLEWAARQRARAKAWMDEQRGDRWDALDAAERMREWEAYERSYSSRKGAADYDDRYAPRRRYDEAPTAADPYDAEPRYAAAREPEPPAAPLHPIEFAYLMPFKDFALYARERLRDPVALEHGPEANAALFEKYQDYRLRFQRKKMEEMFREHRGASWFREKYGIDEPERRARLARRKAGRAGRKERWLAELGEGKLDGVCWDVQRTENSASSAPARRDKTRASIVAVGRLGFEETFRDESVWIPSDPKQVLIRHVPAHMPRDELESVLARQPGYRYLALGEPHPAKEYGRMGWIAFEAAEGLSSVVDALNDHVFPSNVQLTFEIANRPASARLRTTPEYACAIERLEVDLRQAQELVAVLEREDREELWKEDMGVASDADAARLVAWLDTDASKAIARRCEDIDLPLEGGSEDMEEKRKALKKHLDLHLDLLREVYHCDYYGGLMCEFAEELARRSPLTLRKCPPAGESVEKPRESATGTTSPDKLWAEHIDQRVALLTHPDKVPMESVGGDDLTAKMLAMAAPFSQMDEEEKHHCIVVTAEGKTCGKPFLAPQFVHKHVVNKHRAFLETRFGDEIREIKYYNSYVSDPGRVMPQLTPTGPSAAGQAGAAAGGGTSAASAAGKHRGGGERGAPPPLAARLGYDVGAPVAWPPHHQGGSDVMRMGRTIPAGRGGGIDAYHHRSVSPEQQRRSINGFGSLGARLGERIEEPRGLPSAAAAAAATAAAMAEPLPAAPRPLDPRAKQAPTSYNDLDGAGGAAGELELEY